MDVSKLTAVAISGLVFAGTAALAVGAATPAGAETKAAVHQDYKDNYKVYKKRGHHSDDANGGGGGGTNQIYNPSQKFDPFQQNKAW